MRAQYKRYFTVHKKRILRVARRVVERDVEQIKIVFFVFHPRTFGPLKAQAGEDGRHTVLRHGKRMAVAFGHGIAGEG